MTFLLVGCGAFLGGCLRAMLSDNFNRSTVKLPIGTLLANVIGSILLGIFTAMTSGHQPSALSSLLLGTGLCGGLTTFSTFSLESYRFFQKKDYSMAVFYWLGSLLLCLLSIYLGIWLYDLIY